MINGERIKQVRELRGLTQKEFAQSIGVHQSEIAQIETGRITPGDDIVQQIAFKVGFPLSFFKQPTSIDFPLGSLLYRARASITLKERNKAKQFARTIYEVIERFQNHRNIVNEITLRVPCLDDLPENAAVYTRSAFGLSPDTPIDNLINVLELNGCVVIALPTAIEKIDAFSLWIGQQNKKPIIALVNAKSSGDRLRFSIAHELGHLVIHQRMMGSIKEMDEEANVFAGEFLMPKEAMFKELTPPVTILSLMQLKSKWKVSMQALVSRAHRLQIINPTQYRYLMYQISSRYGRKTEPIEIIAEKPRLFGQLAEALYGSPVDYKKLASHVNLPMQLVRETIEAHLIRNKLIENQASGSIINFTRN
jgi:Zn-dependent peptidase ImmA (M78 family)/DNA-binding XRE family transcriptional regulator